MVKVVFLPIMRVTIRCRGIMNIEDMREFLCSAEPLEFQGVRKEEKYTWVEETLKRYEYLRLTKKEKGIVRAYMTKLTGLSSSQLTRLIYAYRWTAEVKSTTYRRHRFPTRYMPEDICLLARVDEINERLSGPATKEVLRREHEVFGKEEYERLKGISVAHLYNLRKTRSYLNQTTLFKKTKHKSVNIGERRKPDPQGRPGYLRVDTVHQGDKNGKKGVYHINTIDEVTQWQVVSFLGGEAAGAVGFAIGLERFIKVITFPQDLGRLITDIYIVTVGNTSGDSCLEVATLLRGGGFSVQFDFQDRSVKAQMRQANKLGVRWAVIIGEEELKRDNLLIKNMLTAEQKEIPKEDLLTLIRDVNNQRDL